MGSGKAEPLEERVFQEEPIRPRQSASADRLPAYVREVVGKDLPRRGNAPAEKLTLQHTEVAEAKWITGKELKEMIKNGSFHNYGKEYFESVFEKIEDYRGAVV